MVYCCVPKCGTDSWKCDPSITFHDFPSSPDLAAKWIQQINCAVKCYPMWFPKGKSVLCSKHFLSTDFKDDSDTLKPRIVPTVFGFKYIGQSPDVVEDIPQVSSKSNSSPLIVKIKTEEGNKGFTTTASPKTPQIEKLIKQPEPQKESPFLPTPNSDSTNKTYSKMCINQKFDRSLHIENANSTKDSPKIIINPSKKFLNNQANQKNNQAKKFTNDQANNLLNNLTNQKNTTQAKLKHSNQDNQKNKVKKPPPQKRENNDNLIEIGPNTFLKINPDIIKINKKLTPSGNTVLQFLMDQTLANTIGADVLPKIVQGAISNITEVAGKMNKENVDSQPNTDSLDKPPVTNPEPAKPDTVVQHVLGHLVDTHVCQESCAKLQKIEDDIMMETDLQEPESMDVGFNDSVSEEEKDSSNQTPAQPEEPVKSVPPVTSNKDATEEVPKSQNSESLTSKEKAETSCIDKAPVLLTTNMSLAHCFSEKTKYLNNLRQKSRQIAALKQKVSSLNKKIEELEDKCIVQERQLSFSFLKRLRTIHKNASKGDPAATYILEQVRAYTGQKQMRWSNSTLQQCAIWCRKAPYAYEYFKKADFFKLPCLGTVKRYMRKHPEMSFTNKSSTTGGNEDDASSSDFDFDEESMDGHDKEEHTEATIVCETVMSEETSNPGQVHELPSQDCSAIKSNEEESDKMQQTSDSGVTVENGADVVAVDGTSLEVQELILPSGEVVQCYSSNLCNGSDVGNQYYIIPNEGDQSSGINHEYSIIQSADSVPVILQNIDSSQIHQEQLIFITNSTEQVECTETEVITAQ